MRRRYEGEERRGPLLADEMATTPPTASKVKQAVFAVVYGTSEHRKALHDGDIRKSVKRRLGRATSHDTVNSCRRSPRDLQQERLSVSGAAPAEYRTARRPSVDART